MITICQIGFYSRDPNNRARTIIYFQGMCAPGRSLFRPPRLLIFETFVLPGQYRDDFLRSQVDDLLCFDSPTP